MIRHCSFSARHAKRCRLRIGVVLAHQLDEAGNQIRTGLGLAVQAVPVPHKPFAALLLGNMVHDATLGFGFQFSGFFDINNTGFL